jgi:hypothetical protein
MPSYLQRFKEQYPRVPEYYSDDEIIDFLPKHDPQTFGNLDREQVRFKALDDRWAIIRGLDAGLDQLQGMGGGAIGIVGDLVGSDTIRDFGLDIYRRNMEEAALSAPETNFFDIDGVGDALNWAGYTLGNLAPMMATSVAGGGVGGLLAKQAVKKSAAAMTAKLISQGMTKEAAAKEAGAFVAKRVALGQALGAGTASVGMSTGNIYGETEDAAVSAVHGLIAGSIDALPIMRIFDRFGASKLAKEALESSVIREIGKQGIREAGTEAVQTFIEQHAGYWVENEGRSLLGNLGDTDWREIGEAAAAGALGGSVMGGGASLVGGDPMLFRKPTAGAPKDDLDQAIDQADRAASDTLARGGDNLDAELARVQSESQTLPGATEAAQARARQLFDQPITAPDSPQTIPGQMPAFPTIERPSGNQTIPGEWNTQPTQSRQTVYRSPVIAPLIASAERAGMSNEVTRLEAANRMLATAQRFEQEQEQARAQTMRERAQAIIDDVQARLPQQEIAPQSTQQVGEQITIWTGRRGDGYASMEAAEAGLRTRERARRDLDWRIEPMANGRYQIAGYSQERETRGRLTRPDMGAVDTLAQASEQGAANRAGRLDPAREQMRGAAIDRIMLNIEQRNGVATQQEAQQLEEYGMGRPFDRVQESVGIPDTSVADPEISPSPGALAQSASPVAPAPVLQNRDRATPASIEQMQGIAAAPDYSRAGFSRMFADGAPVVEPGVKVPDSQMGRSDTATTAEGRKIPIQYAVVEADQLIPSHKADGTRNEQYENGQEGISRAIAGNARVAGLQRAHDIGTAPEYVSAMASDAALHGIDAEVIRAMKRPILVRIMPQEEVTANIGDESNTRTTADLSPSDQAKADARRVNAEGIVLSEDGEVTRKSAEEFVRAMTQTERAGLMDKGQPNRRAYDRLSNLVFRQAFDSDALLRLQSEAIDPEIRTIMAGLRVAAPKLARLRGADQYDIRGLVEEAAEVAVNAKRSNQTLAQFVEQGDIGRNPEIQPILEMMVRNIRSAKRIGEALSNLADLFYSESQRSDADMFGEVQKRSRNELMGEFYGNESRSTDAQNLGDAFRTELDGAGIARTEAERSEPAGAGQTQGSEQQSAQEVTNPSPETTIKIAADSLDRLRKQDVSRALEAAEQISHDHLLDVTLYIKRGRPELREEVESWLEDMAGFLEDSSNNRIATMSKRSLERTNRTKFKADLMARTGGDLAGIQLSNSDETLFVVFSPESGSPGEFRSTRFDARGFSGHSTRDTYQKLLDEAIVDGYRQESPGALERLSQTRAFADGNEAMDKIQRSMSDRQGFETQTATPQRDAKELAAIQKHSLPIDTAFERGRGMATGKYRARSGDIEGMNFHPSFDEAAKDLSETITRQAQSEADTGATQRLAEEIQSLIKGGKNPTSAQWSALLNIPVSMIERGYVYQKDISAFLREYFDVPANNIAANIGRASGVVTSDMGTETKIVYLNRLAEALAQKDSKFTYSEPLTSADVEWIKFGTPSQGVSYQAAASPEGRQVRYGEITDQGNDSSKSSRFKTSDDEYFASLAEAKKHSMAEVNRRLADDGYLDPASLVARTLDEDGRATDGKPIMPGDTFKTLSGRMTTPYPKQKGEKYASRWLIDNATAEAESRSDRFNARSFAATTPQRDGSLASSDRESMLMYLFAEQPAVVPGITRPLSAAQAASSEAVSVSGQQESDSDWLAKMFPDAETTARMEENAKRQIDAVRSAIKTVSGAVDQEIETWSAKRYRSNSRSVELQGDGPRNSETMSIGAINEGRKRKALEALGGQKRAIEKLQDRLSTDAGTTGFIAEMQSIMDKAEAFMADDSAFKPENTTAESLFEAMVLENLGIKPSSGSYSSNQLSKAILAAMQKDATSQEAASVSGQDKNDKPRFSRGEAAKNSAEVDISDFQTGRPVTFNYAHNTNSATKMFGIPKKDSKFNRYYDPSGKYMVQSYSRDDRDGMEYGEITFQNPLVVPNNDLNWKKELSDRFGGKRGKELSKALIAAGYDGVVTYETDRDGNPAYTSEMLDLTSFDEKKARFSRSEAAKGNLYVGHNLSESNLMHVDELGALAAPSLAVARTEFGFDGFGEITLVAGPQLLESSKVKTFDADIYTPRHPRAQYTISRSKYESLVESMGETYGLDVIDADSLESKGAEAFLYSDAAKLAYLREQGKEPKTKSRKPGLAVRKIASLDGTKWEKLSSPEVKQLAAAYFEREAKRLAGIDEALGAKIRDRYFQDGEVRDFYLRNLVDDAQALKDHGDVDVGDLRAKIRSAFKTRKAESTYEAWAKEKFNEIKTGARLFKGFTNSGNRRYIDYNLDNVVKEMTASLQGGEDFNYGTGSVRSIYANRLSSVKAVQKSRDKIISPKEFAVLKEQSNDRFEKLLEYLKPFYRFDASGWGYGGDASRAIAEGDKGLREAFDLDADAKKRVRQFIEYLADMPTSYFEAKAQRAVDLSEFSVAVVPSGTSQKALDILKSKGLKVVTYKRGDNDSRRQAIAKQSKVLFSRQNSNATTITLDRATALINGITGRLNNAPEVIVVQNMQDSKVPEAVRREDAKQRSQGASGDPEGFYYQGKAYIVLDGLTKRKGESDAGALFRVFAHEVLGHAGLRGLFKADLNRVLTEVIVKRIGDVRKKAVQYGLDMSKLQDRLIAAEEVLAEMAQTNPTNSLVTKAVEAIRKALKKLFAALPGNMKTALEGKKFIEWANALTDAEIIDRFIVPAREYIRDGQASATGNAVAAFQRSNAASWYRSDLQQNIGKIRQMANKQGMIGKDQAKQWIDAATKKGMFKAGEVEWTGLKEWLDLAGDKVSVDDIQAFVSANGVQVQDVVLGGKTSVLPDNSFMEPNSGEVDTWENWQAELRRIADEEGADFADMQAELIDVSGQEIDDAVDATKHGTYQLPGGENYREVLLTLPEQGRGVDWWYQNVHRPEAVKESGGDDSAIFKTVGEYDADAVEFLNEMYNDWAAKNKAGQAYVSSHFPDHPNLLAHVRMNDRTDADENKVLFIEEIQSDWAQAGRKKGFKQPPAKELPEGTIILEPGNEFADAWAVQLPAPVGGRSLFYGNTKKEAIDIALESIGQPSIHAVSSAPFVGNTKAWTSLALKRIIAMAAEGGYDKVAFINGAQSADRYDLSKKISAIDYEVAGDGLWEVVATDRNREEVFNEDEIGIDRIEEVFGKEIAQKIQSNEGRKASSDVGGYRDWRTLSGLDLKVGGEGMKSFYDQIVPATLKDLAKKFGGGQIESVSIDVQGRPERNEGLDTKNEYTGPELSPNEINAIASDPDMGVAVRRSLIDIRNALRNGAPFAEAVLEYGSIAAAEAIGGKLTPMKSVPSTQLGITITDAMRDNVESGLPLFSRDMFGDQDDFSLDQYTEKEISQREQMERDRKNQTAKALQKQAVDDQLGDFTLTGSNSEADKAAARGQRSLFSRSQDQTQSPEFKRWFGESKVVDDSGNPLVVYHGTDETFDVFDKSELGRKTIGNAGDPAYGATAFTGFWFNSGEIRQAKNSPYSRYVDSYVRIGNPREFDSLDDLASELRQVIPEEFDDTVEVRQAVEEWVQEQVSEGYDGLILNDEEFGGQSYVAFRPEQIKSATGNNGQFDAGNPDIRFSRAGRTGSNRSAWPAEFPEAIFAADIGKAKQHPDYEAAKAGDVDAALSVVESLVDDAAIEKLRDAIGDKAPIVVPVIAEEATGSNMIPMAYAKVVADSLGLESSIDIIQTVRANHTGSRAFHRIGVQPVFEGVVQSGADYLIVDDAMAMGGTLANLRGYIEASGGNVILVSALTGHPRGTTIAASDQQKQSLISKHGRELDEYLNSEFGFGIDALTHGEAAQILSASSLDEIRSRITAAQSEAGIGSDRSDDGSSQVRFSRSDSTGFAIPDETLAAVAIRKIQDKFKFLKDLQASIIKSGGTITEENNAYLAEELFHGKAENDIREMQEQYIEPLADKMAKFDINRDKLDQYLYARHAAERNARIAEINPEMPDGGSGMTNAEARAILSEVRDSGRQDQYDQLAGIVYDMLKLQRDMVRNGGLESDATIDAWEDGYQYYVPLKGWAEDTKQEGMPRTGKGFAISGRESKRAMGRGSQAASPTSFTIIDLTEKLIRRRKNEVGNAFLKLVRDNPNKDYWQVFTDDKPETQRTIKKVKDPGTGEMVEQVTETAIPMAMLTDRYFTTKKGGKTFYIKLEDPRLMKAMKNIGPESNNALIRTMSGITRVMSALNTSYSPEFMISNFARDVQTAILNLQAEQSLPQGVGKAAGTKIATKTTKDIPVAMRAIYASLRNKELGTAEGKRWQVLFEQFRQDGAKTGWFDMKDLDGQSKSLDNLVAMAQGGLKGRAMKFAQESARVVENLNQAVENAVRLSAYANAIDAGISRKQAASLAKNMTVNFNRRGEVGTTMNALYMFANASVQGTANLLRTMATFKGDGTPRWKNMNNAQKLASGIMAGAYFIGMANRMAAGEDEDDENWYDKVPDYVKERNIVLMKSLFGGPQDGSYWKIPLPYGYNIFSVVGTSAESVLGGGKPVSGAAADIALATMGSFSPIGFQESDSLANMFLKNAAPTLIKPIVEVSLNENFMGTSIYTENMPFGTPKPDSSLGRQSTPEAYRKLSIWLNEVTGGSEYQPGAVDVNPDVMQHFLDYFGGSAYAFFGSKVPDYIHRSASGVVAEENRIPFISRISGTVLPYADTERFYQRRDQINQVYDEFRAMPVSERGNFDGRAMIRLRPLLRGTERQLAALRKQRDAIYAADLSLRERDPKLKEIEQKMKAVVARFNKAFSAVDQ